MRSAFEPSRLRGLVAFAVVVLAVSAISVACGGGGSDTQAQEAYFEEIVRIAEEYGPIANRVQDDYDLMVSVAEGEEQQVNAFLFFVRRSGEITRAEIAEREKVEAPPNIKDAHLELLTSARIVAKVYEDLIEEAAGAKTPTELARAISDSDYESRIDEAQGRAQKACVALQTLALEAGVEGDIC